MARNGYWLCEFLSISRILKKARSKYLRSFLYCETDDNDLTYFLLSQLRVLRHAITELHTYLARKANQMQEAERIIRRHWRTKLVLNERQLALLAHALRTPNASYTVESHRRSHAVTYETARTDLLALSADGLLLKRKSGRAFVFVPTEKLADRAGS
jgi:Fic family protein